MDTILEEFIIVVNKADRCVIDNNTVTVYGKRISKLTITPRFSGCLIKIEMHHHCSDLITNNDYDIVISELDNGYITIYDTIIVFDNVEKPLNIDDIKFEF